MVFVSLLWPSNRAGAFRHFGVEHCLRESLIRHPLHVPSPSQHPPGNNAVDRVTATPREDIVVGHFVPPRDAQDSSEAPKVEGVEQLELLAV